MKIDLNFKFKTFNELPWLKWLSSKKIKISSKKKPAKDSDDRFDSRRRLFEIFFPKAIGIAFKDNDLLITMACKRTFRTEQKTIKVPDFLSRDLNEVHLGINAFFKRSLNEVVLSIPRQKVLVREIDFPGADLIELKEALKYQLDSFLPFDSEDAYYDLFHAGNDEELRKILLIAIKKSDLDHIITKLKELGIVPTKVIISPISFTSLINNKRGKLVTIHKSQNNFCYNIFNDGVFCSTLVIYDKNTILKNIEMDMPDEILESDRFLLDENDVYKVIKEEDPDNVGDAEDEKITNYKSIPISGIDDNQESFGAALYGIESTGTKFSIFNTGKRGFHKQKFLMFGFFGLLIIVLFFIPRAIEDRKLQALNIVNSKIRNLKTNISRIEDIQNRLTDMEETVMDIGKIRAEYVPRIKVLHELSEKLPRNAWIKELYIYRNNFEIGGTAVTATDLIRILEDSELFSNVGLTAPVVNTAAGKESFRLRGEINKGS